MKKICFVVCCLLMTGTVLAQDAPPAVHPGDAPAAAVVENVAAVVEAPAQEAVATIVESTALPQEDVAISQETVVNEGVVIQSAPALEAPATYTEAPMTYQVAPTAPVAGCSGCGTTPTPVMAPSVMTQSVVAAPTVAPVAVSAPVATYAAAPVATCSTCDNGINRRYVVRGVATRVSTRGRTVVSRVRGRRNNCCY